MANIRRIEGKTGVSYKITVSSGRDGSGKQKRHYMTWTPEPKMTERQIDKELQRVAFEFERQIEQGFAVDNRQTFEQYARYVIDLKERTGAKHRTIENYNKLMRRIVPAIGHIKLTDLRPQHLNAFYANLSEKGMRETDARAVSLPMFSAALKRYSRARTAADAGISPATVDAAAQHKKITLTKAQAIARVLNQDVEKLFQIERNSAPLSAKTITEYHRLISAVLTQAEKEMLVFFNAAAKATPPKLERKEAQTFQPDEVQRIRDALECEPLKWKTLVHLLLITGARRGEVAGLHWDSLDWDRNTVRIDRALLYTKTRGVYEDTTKTGNVRHVSLPEETMILLHQYRKWQSAQQLLCGDRWQNTGYIFTRDDGLPMHPDSLTGWLADFAKRHDIPNVHPHKFRHTMASLLYFGGVDGVAISKRLGHAKVSTTSDLYAHLIEQADRQAGECIAAAVLRPQNMVVAG